MREIKRVNIIGPPGSGKTALARILSKKYGLPIVHMDGIAHQKKFNPLYDKSAFMEKIKKECMKNEWVMEGTYKSTLVFRMPRADVTIYLDLPRAVYMRRVLRRRWEYRNKSREEMPQGWKEKLDWDFMKYLWRFHVEQKGPIERLLDKTKGEYITLRSPKEVDEYVNNIV